jgi:uncharacterized protein with FMN-binding domain
MFEYSCLEVIPRVATKYFMPYNGFSMENTTPQPSQLSTPKNAPMIGLVAVAALVILATGVFAYQAKNKTSAPAQNIQQTPSTTQTSETPAATTAPTTPPAQQSYKDGSYDVMGEYISPGGPEQIEVKMTLKEGTISAVDVISKTVRPQSKNFQNIFIANYKPMVLGKNIDEVQLTKVSGSSLTPKGFNDALQKIKSEAKV